MGLFFSLGHSTVVVLATVGIAPTALAFADDFERVRAVGGLVGDRRGHGPAWAPGTSPGMTNATRLAA